ncbi:C40 family peptidase [Jiella pelagia]|uniref:C40 family peptidase n=1 Tax=Jiella pelagia TaxID=2986949 RepID=UPI002E36FDB6|nr:NlpC/P60 family protein [Jiella pelagia]
MPETLDARLNAFRPDLADARLKGRVEASRFVEGEERRVAAAIAPLRRRPEHDAPLDTELLMGERVRLFEESDEGWCWLQAEGDSYVGYVPSACLANVDETALPTARISVPRTLVFPAPDIKRPPLAALPMGARISVTGEASDQNADYAKLASGGFVVRQHIAPLDSVENDYVAVAERFIGVPYLWGGKSALGIDCSGLVQLALEMTGAPAPRDSDMQQRETRHAHCRRRGSGARRSDLLERPRGHHGRRPKSPSRQCPPHDGGERAASRQPLSGCRRGASRSPASGG